MALEEKKQGIRLNGIEWKRGGNLELYWTFLLPAKCELVL